MNKIIALIRRLLGLEETVESITAPITKIVNKLDAYSVEQIAQAEADKRRAEELAQKADTEVQCATEAAQVAANMRNFCSGKAA